jgi:GNAT superfamily N-acetyltransferase
VSVRLGAARAADLPQLVALLGILFAQEHELSPDARKQRRGLRLILANPAVGRIYVARERGQVLGMVSILRSVSTAEGGPVGLLEDLVVLPERRGRGLGGRLLAYAIARARSAGLQRLILLTDGDNYGAQRLYARAGFARSQMLSMRLRLRRSAGT